MKKYKVRKWNLSTQEYEVVKVTINELVTNVQKGFYMGDIGLALLNVEREKLGLTQFVLNLDTGTYDEQKR